MVEEESGSLFEVKLEVGPPSWSFKVDLQWISGNAGWLKA